MKKLRKALPVSIASGLFVCLVLFSAQAKAAAAAAMELCAMTLVPTLFPFYAAVNLLLNAGVSCSGKTAQAVMQRCFRLPGEAAPALLLGLLGGYPVGASVTASLYRQGLLTRDEAIRLSMFANNAGPGFVIGAVGMTVFHSVPLGMLLLCIHGLSALAVGCTLRTKSKTNPTVRRAGQTQTGFSAHSLSDAVSAALQSMLMICAYVVFCSVCLAVLRSIPPLRMLLKFAGGLFPAADAVFSGIGELSCGILALRGVPAAEAFICASVLLAWGGLCVFLQGAAVLYTAGLPARQCLHGKLRQAAFSGILSYAVCRIRLRPHRSVLYFVIIVCLLAVLRKIRGRKKELHLL